MDIQKPVFKGKMKKWFTTGLFLEPRYLYEDENIFTIKGEDFEAEGKVYKSARRLFVECGDPTGYAFSQEHLGGWDHWKHFYNSSLKEMIDEWIEEVEAKLKSEAISVIQADSNSESKSSIASAKFLSGKGWQSKRKAGAPTKEEKAGQLKKAKRTVDAYDDDAKRIGLKLVK